jgi:hypothetical protein
MFLPIHRIKYFDGLMEQYEAAAAKAQADGKQFNWDPNVLRAQAAISSTSPMGVVWVSCRPPFLLRQPWTRAAAKRQPHCRVCQSTGRCRG